MCANFSKLSGLRNLGALLVCSLVCVTCTPRGAVAPGSVSGAWQDRRQPEERVTGESSRAASIQAAAGTRAMPSERDPIANVNGHPIARHRVVNLLLQAQGVGVLEQLVVLDEAERRAADRGLTITQAEIQAEYDRALRRLVAPLSSVTTGSFDREAAERTLEVVLADRNISREEFMLGMRRHAYLRRLVEAERSFSEQDIRAEYERTYGRRVQVRHIQLGTPRQVSQVRQQFAAGGDFAELARDYSANQLSAELGGLLEPFSAQQEELPTLFRQTAFGLEPGEVSETIRIGEWYHILKLEKAMPAEDPGLDRVRDALERRLRERTSEPAMQALYERLFRDAVIEIHDPVLRRAFDRTHPDRQRG
jgi:foldase protein PrsA